MNLPLILFLIGVLGFVLNRKNIILMLISIEIILLAITLRRDKSILFSRIVIVGLISTSFLALNNFFIKPLEKGIGIYGGLFNVTTFTLYMIATPISKSLRGLSILIAFYRLRGILLNKINHEVFQH